MLGKYRGSLENYTAPRPYPAIPHNTSIHRHYRHTHRRQPTGGRSQQVLDLPPSHRKPAIALLIFLLLHPHPFLHLTLIPLFSCVLIEFFESGVFAFSFFSPTIPVVCHLTFFFYQVEGKKFERPDNLPSYVSLLSLKVLSHTLSLQVL